MPSALVFGVVMLVDAGGAFAAHVRPYDGPVAVVAGTGEPQRAPPPPEPRREARVRPGLDLALNLAADVAETDLGRDGSR